MNPVSAAQPMLSNQQAPRHGCASAESPVRCTSERGAQQVVSESYSRSVDVSLSAQGLSLAYQESASYSVSYVEQVQSATRSAPAQVLNNDPQNVAASATAIVGFIDNRLADLASQGASEAEIAAALEQARSGFAQGLSEAVDILQGYGLYQGPIEEGVVATQQAVEDGLAELTGKYLPSPQVSDAEGEQSEVTTTSSGAEDSAAVAAGEEPGSVTEPATSSGASSTQPAEQPAELPDTSVDSATNNSGAATVENKLMRYTSSEKLSVRQSLDLQVRTQDGDLVTVSIDTFQAFRERLLQLQDDAGNSLTQYSAKSLFKSAQLFEVKGELDEDELRALTELFSQVADLADEFFSGNLDQAFEQALALNMDSNELAAISLDLQQAVRYRGVERYQEVAGEPSRKSSLPELAHYVNKLIDLVHKTNESLEEPKQGLRDAFASVFGLMDNRLDLTDRVAARHQQLLDSILAA